MCDGNPPPPPPGSPPPSDTVAEYEVQFRQQLEQERVQWTQYREAVEREMADLRFRLSEGQEEENLENDMKKVLPHRANPPAVPGRGSLRYSSRTVQEVGRKRAQPLALAAHCHQTNFPLSFFFPPLIAKAMTYFMPLPYE